MTRENDEDSMNRYDFGQYIGQNIRNSIHSITFFYIFALVSKNLKQKNSIRI